MREILIDVYKRQDYVRAGTPLSDGAITPADILAIKGPTAVQEYIVNEVQDVYRCLLYTSRQLRNADPADDASAREVINNLFFSEKRYDLGEVGRYRINKK